MVGRSTEDADKLGRQRNVDEAVSRQFELPGNRSHSLLLIDTLSPECLGALIAAYEHKTYFLAVLLGINAFDQWGVELGKEIAAHMRELLTTGETEAGLDPSTLAAAQAWRAANTD
jgi:glucose-6-phosphate isomerase